MGKPTGFLEYTRNVLVRRRVDARLKDYREFELDVPVALLKEQGARCMDCGVPTCHGGNGCPLGNLIPDWNDLVMGGHWKQASQELHRTNAFPEVTGRVCPAPCEDACVLGIIDDPVSIKSIEKSIADRAFEQGWVHPQPALQKMDKKVAVIGSGPAGLAGAQGLARLGYEVVVFEKNDRLGGLLTYGIPNFKLEQSLVQRRVKQLEAEGVRFQMGVHVGKNYSAEQLRQDYDAVLLATGAERARHFAADVQGRSLRGVHLAMDYLTQQNRRNYGDVIPTEQAILATDKRVIILGGGDTGADCLGTTHRQGAREVHQLEIMPKPKTPKVGTSHEEGGIRKWSALTKSLQGQNGELNRLDGVELAWELTNGAPTSMKELSDKAFSLPVDMVILAMGFLGPVREGLLETLDVQLTPRGNVEHDNHYMTNIQGVFVAGDCARGASLVVWAIQEGRDAALAIHQYLTPQAHLSSLGRGVLALGF